jgi:hypothetical protein
MEDIGDSNDPILKEERKEWDVFVRMIRGYKLRFDKPITFENAMVFLEKNNFGSEEDVDEIIIDEILDLASGVFVEGGLDASIDTIQNTGSMH